MTRPPVLRLYPEDPVLSSTGVFTQGRSPRSPLRQGTEKIDNLRKT